MPNPWKAPAARDSWIVLGVFLGALALRLICLHQIRQTPLFDFFARDSAEYEDLAVKLLAGDFASPGSVYFNAVYPSFLALVYLLFGHTLGSALLVQTVLGAATAALLYLAGRKLSGDRVVSLLAALLFAGHDLSVFFGVFLLDATLSAFLLAGLALTLAYAADGRHPGAWPLSGAIFGLSLALRTNVAVFLPFLAIWLFTRGTGVGRGKALSLFCVGAALALAPFSLRRLAVDGEISPFPVSGGLNFYIGNNPRATGGFASLEHLGISTSPGELIRQSIVAAGKEAGRGLSASGASRHWFLKGLGFIRENPARFFTLSFRKALLFWNRGEGEANLNFSFGRQFLPVLSLPLFSFAVIGPLGLAGLALALWRRSPGFSLIALFVVSYAVSLSLVFMDSRYRFPCVPAIALLAAYALGSLGRSLRERKAGEVAATLLLAAACFATANLNLPGAPPEGNFSAARFNLGNLHLERGRLAEAAGEYLKIPPADPTYARARYNLGLVFERRGLADEAMAEYRNALAAKPDFAKAHNNLGLLCFRKGLKEEALLHYREALASEPDFEGALVNLGWYYQDRGLLAEADQAYRRALAVNPGSAAATYDLAVLSYRRNEIEEAGRRYREAVRLGHGGNPALQEALGAGGR